ncbi:hypothetical protein ACI3PL_22495, partial [Lacticaseibacillus paracasei]
MTAKQGYSLDAIGWVCTANPPHGIAVPKDGVIANHSSASGDIGIINAGINPPSYRSLASVKRIGSSGVEHDKMLSDVRR